uniref:Uncharacterized protein n=1 Tax=Solanum tuberosum TaxID=4113 RepID=M1DLU6_SOLTU
MRIKGQSKENNHNHLWRHHRHQLQPNRLQVPTLVMQESLMNLFNEPPTNQSLDDFWGELPKGKSGKRKHKVGESYEELRADLSKEERRQHKKFCNASLKKAREEEALAQQQ